MIAIAANPISAIRKLKTRWGDVLSSRFLADARHLATGTFFGQLIGLAASPILTRIFAPNDFGIYASLLATTMFIAAFGALRLESLIPAAQRPLEALRLLQFMIGLSVVAAVFVLFGIMFFGDSLARLLSIPEGGAVVLLMLPVSIIAFGLYSGVRAWSVRKACFAAIGRAQIFRAVIMVAVPVLIGITGLLQIPGFLLTLGQALGFIAFAGLLLPTFNQRELRILATPSWQKVKSALATNASMVRAAGLSQIIAAIHSRLPILVIAAVYGPLEAGFYGLAERVVTAPSTLISKAIGDVYRQRAAKMHHEGLPFIGLFHKVAVLTFAFAIVPYTIAFVVIPPRMGLIFGSEWEGAAFTMSVLLIAAGVSFWTTALDNTAITVGAGDYMVLWESLRLAIEAGATLAAILYGLSYEGYLIWSVVGRVLLYLGDIVTMREFSRRGKGF